MHTLIFPILDYCDIVYADINESLATKLQHVQNACARFVFNLKPRDHISESLEKLKWLRLHDRRLFHGLTLTYKLLSAPDTHPAYLVDRVRIFRRKS